MDAWAKWLAGIVATLIGVVVLPLQGLYWYGASALPERVPMPRQEYSTAARQMYWRANGGAGPIAIRRLNPIRYAWITFGLMSRERPSRVPADLMTLSHAARTSRPELDHARLGNSRRHTAEVALSIRLSRELEPVQIIDLVLDQSWYGREARGLEAAAQTYYGVSAAQLTPEETFALIALPGAPSVYDPICRRLRFEQRYIKLAPSVGLDATPEAMQRALQRLRPHTCPPSNK